MKEKIVSFAESAPQVRLLATEEGAESAPKVRLLVTEEDLAFSLNVSERHLRELRARRLIPFIKLGRVVRYRMADVERALTDHLTLNARFTDKGGAA